MQVVLIIAQWIPAQEQCWNDGRTKILEWRWCGNAGMTIVRQCWNGDGTAMLE